MRSCSLRAMPPVGALFLSKFPLLFCGLFSVALCRVVKRKRRYLPSRFCMYFSVVIVIIN